MYRAFVAFKSRSNGKDYRVGDEITQWEYNSLKGWERDYFIPVRSVQDTPAEEPASQVVEPEVKVEAPVEQAKETEPETKEPDLEEGTPTTQEDVKE